jgi:hypothetical protein
MGEPLPRTSYLGGFQEDHDLARDLLLGPGSGDTAGSYRTDARHFPQPLWLRFDGIEHLLAKGRTSFLA